MPADAGAAIALDTPGTTQLDRLNQLDINLAKAIKTGGITLKPEISLFNALDNHAVFTVRSMNYLTSSYLQPSNVLQPRLLRLEVQVKW